MSYSGSRLALTILALVSACAAPRETTLVDAPDGGGRLPDGGGGRVDVPDTVPTGLTSIRVDPPLAELIAENGGRPEQTFTVLGTFENGETNPIGGASFSLGSSSIGAIGSASGKFVASGVAGGETEVRVEVLGPDGKQFSAKAALRVSIRRLIVADSAPPGAVEKLAGVPVNTPEPELVYPLEGAVMPQNVFPADVQWLNGSPGDLFELAFEKPSVVVRAVLFHSGAGFKNSYVVDGGAWRALAQSDPKAPVVVSLKRWDSAKNALTQGPQVRFSFASAALTGSVYYWDIEKGRIQRIDDGTNVAVSFLPNPPAGAVGQDRCVGCHSVSPSGRYMAARLGGGNNTGTVFDLTRDLTADPVPSVFAPTSSYWWFSSWSPDERQMVVARGEIGPSLAFIDAATGADVTVAGILPTKATQPAWSPDGREIAYVADGNSWGDRAVAGDIAILPVTGPNQVGPARTIHRGDALAMHTPGGVADSYPAFSPDSKLITFTHGTGSRSDAHAAALYLMGRDGSAPVRLDRASGGTTSTDSFQSRFAPFDTGEHFWISFLSRRNYGNAQAGTRGMNRQQIWVAAIRKDAKPGEDPSEVGYWLPGQQTTSKNISAYWAPRACRKDGDGCSVGSECCGGDCRPNENNALVCSPPPPDECRVEGQTCSSSSDCCGGQPCTNNVCSASVVQ